MSRGPHERENVESPNDNDGLMDTEVSADEGMTDSEVAADGVETDYSEDQEQAHENAERGTEANYSTTDPV